MTPEKNVTPAPPRLEQQLYAGETGVEARKRGDRLRILVWLQALKLSDAQRKSMEQAVVSMQKARALLAAWEDQRDRTEVELLGPIYEELSAKVLAEDVEIDALNKRLEDARKTLGSAQPERLKHLKNLLRIAQQWLDQLEPQQKLAFQHALFFLRQPVSPQLSPVYYDALVGVAWPDNSFESLRRVRPGEAPANPLDIGGLWQMDEGKTDTTEKIEGLQQEVLTVLALQHPQMQPALQVLAKERAAGDFSEAPTP